MALPVWWLVAQGGIVSAAQGADPLPSATELEQRADELVLPAMQESGVPGALLAVVARERTLLVRAYGVSDTERKSPVSVTGTFFNVASIGKTFSAVMALQLAEEGVLDLDLDVGVYLDGAPSGASPVTLRELLGHQVGFDENLTQLFVAPGESTAVSAGELERRWRQLRKPGLFQVYSNVGYGVVGRVLVAVSGKPYGELVESQVLRHLGPGAGTYVDAATDPASLARCYVPTGPDSRQPCDHYPVYRESIQGAGGMAMSADGMARYMRALLGGDVAERGALLSDASASLLFDPNQYRIHPGVLGAGIGFVELGDRDRAEFGSGGSVPGFSSIMKIFPDAGIGVFFSFMGGQPPTFDAIPSRLVPYLLEYRPRSAKAAAAIASLHRVADDIAAMLVPDSGNTMPAIPSTGGGMVATSLRPEALAGHYVRADASQALGHRLAKLASARSVSSRGGGLVVSGLGEFSPIGASLFENDHGLRLAFSEAGGSTILAINSSLNTFERVPWHRAAGWAIPLVIACLLLLLSAVTMLGRRFTRVRRRSAATALAGAAAVLAGLYLELEYATRYLVVDGEILRPVLWRGAIQIGTLAALAWPVAYVFRRRDLGVRRLLGHVYATALSIAALLLPPGLWLWGVFGRLY